MNVQCPSCKTMVSFEGETFVGTDIWQALVSWLKDTILKNPTGDDLWTCPRCGTSLVSDC